MAYHSQDIFNIKELNFHKSVYLDGVKNTSRRYDYGFKVKKKQFLVKIIQ